MIKQFTLTTPQAVEAKRWEYRKWIHIAQGLLTKKQIQADLDDDIARIQADIEREQAELDRLIEDGYTILESKFDGAKLHMVLRKSGVTSDPTTAGKEYLDNLLRQLQPPGGKRFEDTNQGSISRRSEEAFGHEDLQRRMLGYLKRGEGDAL